MRERLVIRAGDFLTRAEQQVRPHTETINGLKVKTGFTLLLRHTRDGKIPFLLIGIVPKPGSPGSYRFNIAHESDRLVVNKSQLESDPDKKFEDASTNERFRARAITVTRSTPIIYAGEDIKISFTRVHGVGDAREVNFRIESGDPITVLTFAEGFNLEGEKPHEMLARLEQAAYE